MFDWKLPTHRRGFLGRVAGGAAALGEDGEVPFAHVRQDEVVVLPAAHHAHGPEQAADGRPAELP